MTDVPMVVVRGESTVEVPPELAQLSVTVSARHKDRRATLSLLTDRSAVLQAELDRHGGAIERTETSGVHIWADLQKRSSERVRAYVGTVTTQVTVSDLDHLGEILVSIGDADHIEVDGPWWRLRPGSRAGAEVRADALRDALQRADDYAAALGARVDRLIEIADEGTSSAFAVPGRAFLSRGGAVDQDLELDLHPQAQTVTAAVVVRVAITAPQLPLPGRG